MVPAGCSDPHSGQRCVSSCPAASLPFLVAQTLFFYFPYLMATDLTNGKLPASIQPLSQQIRELLWAKRCAERTGSHRQIHCLRRSRQRTKGKGMVGSTMGGGMVLWGGPQQEDQRRAQSCCPGYADVHMPVSADKSTSESISSPWGQAASE